MCEERYDNDEDFADMPRLLPADQEEEPQCSNRWVLTDFMNFLVLFFPLIFIKKKCLDLKLVAFAGISRLEER